MRRPQSIIVVLTLGALAVTTILALTLIYQSATAMRREKALSPSDPSASVRRHSNNEPHPPLTEFTFSQLHMAMPVRITVWCDSRDHAERVCKLAFKRIAELVTVFSDYDQDSEISRLVDRGYGSEVRISPELFEVLSFCRGLNRETDGAFDPSCGPIIGLWRAARKSGQLPTPDAIAQVRERVGFDKIVLNEESASASVSLLASSMRIDFGGVAKGFIGDEVMLLLRENGINIGCFEAGGDFVLGDSPPGTSGWAIEIGADAPLMLSNCGVSTSGDSQQFVEFGGKRYSHVVDPRTGIGVTTGRTAFVIAPCGMQSDALATTGCVLTEDEFQAVLGSYPGVRGWSVVNVPEAGATGN